MKNVSWVLSVLAVLVSSCAHQRVAYKTEVKLSPAEGKPGHYTVEFHLYDLSDSVHPHKLTAPRLILLKGEPAKMGRGTDADGHKFTAVVDEENGVTTAKAKVVVKRASNIVWSCDQTLSVAK